MIWFVIFENLFMVFGIWILRFRKVHVLFNMIWNKIEYYYWDQKIIIREETGQNIYQITKKKYIKNS